MLAYTCLDSFSLAFATETIVREIREEILGFVLDHIGDKALQHVVVPFASGVIVDDVLGAVAGWCPGEDRNQQVTCEENGAGIAVEEEIGGTSEEQGSPRDGREQQRPQLEHPLLVAEEEPPPSKIDSWARGALAIRRPKAVSALDELTQANSSGTTARTERGAKSSRSSLGTNGNRAGKNRRQSRGAASRKSSTGSQQGMVMALDEEMSSFGQGAGYELSWSAFEKECMNKTKADEARRKGEESRVKALEEREAESKARMDRMLKEIKGKEWIFDDDGSVLVLSRFHGDKMCPLHDSPQTSILHKEGGIVPQEEQPPKKKRGKKRGHQHHYQQQQPQQQQQVGEADSVERRAQARGKEQEGTTQFYRVSSSLQPSMLEHIDLKVGVGLKQDGQKKDGPIRNEDPLHMSKRGFQESTNFRPLGANGEVDWSLEETADFGGRGGTGESGRKSRRGGGSGKGRSRRRRSEGGRARAGSKAGRPSFSSTVQSLEPLAGGVRVGSEESLLGSERGGQGGGGGEGGGAGATMTPASFGATFHDEDEGSDPHLQLSQTAEFPISGPPSTASLQPNPPVLPRKTRPRERKAAVRQKPSEQGPKERVDSNRVRPTVERKHLPAPPLGETVGHGLWVPDTLTKDKCRSTGTGGGSKRSAFPPIIRGGGGGGGRRRRAERGRGGRRGTASYIDRRHSSRTLESLLLTAHG